MEFDLTPDDTDPDPVITVYGEKGDGKTTAAISIGLGEVEGFNVKGKTVAVLSFDHKGQRIARVFNENVVAYDAVRYVIDDHGKHDDKELTKSSCKNMLYLFRLVESMNVDIIVVDGSEILTQQAEMLMRYNNDLGVSENFANIGLWKERKIILKRFHRLCTMHSNVAVIYTTYTDVVSTIAHGKTIKTAKVPKWVGTLLLETDIVARVKKVDDEYKMKVESSKMHEISEEKVFDVTRVKQ